MASKLDDLYRECRLKLLADPAWIKAHLDAETARHEATYSWSDAERYMDIKMSRESEIMAPYYAARRKHFGLSAQARASALLLESY